MGKTDMELLRDELMAFVSVVPEGAIEEQWMTTAGQLEAVLDRLIQIEQKVLRRRPRRTASRAA